MQKKTHAVNKVHTTNWNADYIFLLLISIFMIVAPFFRGLFFRINYIPAIAIVSIIFTAFTAYKLGDKNYRVMDTYMDLSVVLIPIAYLISFFFAVNAKDAFDMVLLYSSYFMMYKLTSDLSAKDEKYKNVFINVIIISSFILSFAGMLSVSGIIDFKGSFLEKRLYGLYQYPNTTASVLGVGIVLSLNKLLGETNIKVLAVYQFILTALISSFIFTLSRGGFLMLAGVLLLNFLLIKARLKLKLLLSMCIAFISNSMLIYKFYTLTEDAIYGVWVHYLISIIASAIIIYIIYSFRNLIKFNFSDKVINTVLITMVIIFTGALIFAFSIREPIEYKIEHQASEEESFEYDDIYLYELEPNSSYSIEFDVKASLESSYSYGVVIRSYNSANEFTQLLNNFGPTGPEFTPKSFAFTTLEDTEKVHILLYNYETGSHTVYKDVVIKDFSGIVLEKMEKLKYVPVSISNRLLDINLETKNVSERIYFAEDGLKIIKDYPIAGAGGGAWRNLYRHYQSIPYNTTEVHNFYVQYATEVGIIGLILLIGLLLLLIISIVKSIRADSPYLYVYLSTLLLLLHSSIDFNLSLVAVGYILWMLVGLINSEKYTQLKGKSPHKYMKVFVLAVSLIICISSSFIYYGMKLGVRGAETAKENKDMEKAIELYEKASQFDRYNAAYRYDLAQIMNNQLRTTRDKKYFDKFNKQISLIRKYEPYNHQYTPIICNMYLAIGNFEEASKLADRKLRDEPMLDQSYKVKIDVNYSIAMYYLKDNRVQEAVTYLENILETKEKLKKINLSLKVPIELTEDYAEKIEAANRTLEMIKSEIK